jgi:CubicO group peptidase (beta-lactamase class C family)
MAMIWILFIVLAIVILLFVFWKHPFFYTLKYFPATNEDYKKIKVKELQPGSAPIQFRKNLDPTFSGIKFQYKEADSTVAQFIEKTDTEVFLFIKDDAILYEYYNEQCIPSSPLMIWSVTKVFLSTLTGMAVKQGVLNSIRDKVVDHLPQMKSKLNGDLEIRHLLDMTSGVNYSTRLYDFTPYLEVHYGFNLEGFAKSARSVLPPGEKFRYSQIDAILLTMILRKCYGSSLIEPMQLLWNELGMEHPGYLAVDGTISEMERMASGLFATAIDVAKLGRMYLTYNESQYGKLIDAVWTDHALQNTAGTCKYMTHFWRHSTVKERKFNDAYAVGANGNKMMYLIPEHNAMILRFGKGMSKKGLISASRNLSEAYLYKR